MSLQEKYRPRNFNEVVGNNNAVDIIVGFLERKRKEIPHAWLFHGPAGCGKTTIARILKDELGCSDMAFFEYNSSNTRGIDTIREINSVSKQVPIEGDCKVYILDECHQITSAAQEALLKLLEDAPKDTYFFLCTTNPEKMIKAIKSRCTMVKVEANSPKRISRHLKWICDEERRDVPDAVISAISKNCGGAMRDAIKTLDAVLDIQDEEAQLEIAKTGVTEDDAEVIELCREIANLNPGPSWKIMGPILENFDKDPEATRMQILGYLRKVLISSGSYLIGQRMEFFERNFFDSGLSGLTLACFCACQTTGD